MAEVKRHGPGTIVSQEFYEIEELSATSFCPDSTDASTPATQVHVQIQIKGGLDAYGFRSPPEPPLILRCHGTDTLDAFIEALIENRTFVFGRRKWDASKYETQEERDRARS